MFTFPIELAAMMPAVLAMAEKALATMGPTAESTAEDAAAGFLRHLVPAPYNKAINHDTVSKLVNIGKELVALTIEVETDINASTGFVVAPDGQVTQSAQ